MEECVSIYVYPLFFNNKITNNSVERSIWVTTEIYYDTSEYICVTFGITVFFPALLNGSVEITVISFLPHFNLYNNLFTKIIKVQAI